MKYRFESPRNLSSYHSLDSDGSTSFSNVYAYRKIKNGLRSSNPAAIVLWAFHEIHDRTGNGLTSRKVINFITKHYRAVRHPEKTGKSVGAMLKYAVEFGLLEKHGARYHLAPRRWFTRRYY